MHLITFFIVLFFVLLAVILFGSGLVNIYQGNRKARGLVSSGFMLGLLGVVIAAIVFGFFNL
jgi:hypothetical protein